MVPTKNALVLKIDEKSRSQALESHSHLLRYEREHNNGVNVRLCGLTVDKPQKGQSQTNSRNVTVVCAHIIYQQGSHNRSRDNELSLLACLSPVK